jgi:hypothetical protein
MLLPALAKAKSRAERANCINNLKQVGLAFRVWEGDNGDRYPMAVGTNYGGAKEAIGATGTQAVPNGAADRNLGVFKMFDVMSNELNTPKIVFCPAENENTRSNATTFATSATVSGTGPFVNDYDCSYFIGVDASDTQPQMFLAGDHNMGSATSGNGGGDIVPPNSFGSGNPPNNPTGNDFWALGTNNSVNLGGFAAKVGWLDTIHQKVGNVALGDGSVQSFTTQELQNGCANSGDAGETYMSPYANMTINGDKQNTPPYYNRLQFP